MYLSVVMLLLLNFASHIRLSRSEATSVISQNLVLHTYYRTDDFVFMHAA